MTTIRIDVRAHADASARLVSRGEAKALAAALPRGGTAVLDFTGIVDIGPSYADELFRVFAVSRPSLTLVPINTNEAVSRMVHRAQANRWSEANQE